jgi:hypothetical protein
VLDRIAGALNIKTYQLFSVPVSPVEAMERLHESIVKDINQVVAEAVERVIPKAIEQILSEKDSGKSTVSK